APAMAAVAAPQPGPPVSQTLTPPRVAGTAEGHLSEADARRVQDAVASVPVADPALDVDAGATPALALQGEADPAQAVAAQSALMDKAAVARDQGAAEAAAPMGEGAVYPDAREGDLQAQPGGCPCAGGQTARRNAPGEAPDAGVVAVAEQEKGESVRQAAIGAAGEIDARQQQQLAEQRQADADSQTEVNDAIADNAQQQSDERARARRDADDQRRQWNEGQTAAVNTAGEESRQATDDAGDAVALRQTQADDQAQGHLAKGNQDISSARAEGERQAREKRDQAKRESDGGILGWLASSITSFFNKLREGIHAIFDAARKLVRAAIETAQRLAHEAIDLARRAVVGLIKAAGTLLIAIGDTLLAAFPTLRARFRAAIESVVDLAVAAVNKLADLLERAVMALLNALMAVLNAIICAYELLYTALVDAVASAVKGALDFARAAIAALGAFADLVRDIAAGPSQWLRNLGASIMDGLRNHLWKALKTAVKTWFNETVESIVGMGKMLLDFLRRGAISLRKIAGFVWQAIIQSLPGIIVGFLIEKLISMLVPAAAAIMLVVQGLIAAWGSVQKIIQAAQLFFVFLKAVKNGGAGPQFATALAASAIAVIQFLAMFLIARLGGAASKVSGKLKALAQKLMAFFKRVGRAVGRALKRVGRVVMRGVKALARLGRRGLKALGRLARRGLRAVRRVLMRSRWGRGLLRGLARLRRGMGRLRRRFRRWRERRRGNKRRAAEQRLQRALAEIPPILASTAGSRGIRRALLWLQLRGLQLRYWLRSLRVTHSGSQFQLFARVNPEGTAPVRLEDLSGEFLREVVREAVDRVMISDEVAEAENRMDPNNPTINNPRDYLAYIRRFGAQGTQPLRQGQRRVVQLAGGLSAYETGPRFGATVSNQLVGSGSTYRNLVKRLGNMAKRSGLTEREMIEHVEGLVRSGDLPPRLAKGAAPRDLALLMFGREGIRNPATAAHSVMTLDLIQSGRMPIEQAFDLTGNPSAAGLPQSIQDANPATRGLQENRYRETFLRPSNDPALAPGGANAAKDATAAEPERRAAPPRTDIGGESGRQAQRQHAAREEALIREWLTLQSEAWVFESRAQAREALRALVIERLVRFYRLQGFRTSRR
ncbi:hypothetical protein, partial [uncultured Rhodoblastus sp.]|uniref:hypothetical protein n=1 Tax=uncultured Rhodoblastus sp. TaxID=543037 RepID=UPI0025DD4782